MSSNGVAIANQGQMAANVSVKDSGGKNFQVMGDYLVGDTAGDGGFSIVMIGTHRTTGEKVALKILKKSPSLTASIKRQVEREVDALKQIQNQHVIRLKDVAWEAKYDGKDVILVVLELAAGGELFEFLTHTGCFDDTTARTYFRQLIDALQYCHSLGITHRDLKPENLLLDDHFSLKLADFGFARVFAPTSSRTTYTECGTTGYMAPEMTMGRGYDPFSTDVWACGVILFIMLAGFPPFQSPNMTDWWFAKLATNKHHLFWAAHTRTATFSDGARDLINKILAPDPAKRITLKDIINHPWFQGPIIPDQSLATEFARRKNVVDNARERKKAQERAGMNIKNMEMNESPLTSDQRVMRDFELPPDTPLAPPNMLVFDKTPVAKAFPMSDNDFFSSAASVSQPATRPLPPLYEPAQFTACYTKFESTAPAASVFDRIASAFEDLRMQYTKDAQTSTITGSMVTALGMVTLTAQIFRIPNDSNNKLVVEFRRRKGDSMQYRSIYYELTDHLSDLILQPAAAATNTTTTGAASASSSSSASAPAAPQPVSSPSPAVVPVSATS